MKTLQELQKEYEETETAYKSSKDLYFEKVLELKRAVVQFAKYKAGDKVVYIKRNQWNGTETRIDGIVRDVIASKEYVDQAILPHYYVGKRTKSGKIHSSHNVEWGSISEIDIMPFTEIEIKP